MTRILIAEDEVRLVSFLEQGLRAGGYTTVAVATGPEALALARDDNFDLLVLDIRLPGMDGHEVLQAMRARGETMPVVILSARDDVEDAVAGLQEGADDYVVKPFRFDELLARIGLRLRDHAAPESTVLVAGGVSLDLRSRRASVLDPATGTQRIVELTAREFALAEVFLRHAEQVMSREQLLSQAWGDDFHPDSNVLEVYVGYLRRKLGDSVIETVRGIGYRLAV